MPLLGEFLKNSVSHYAVGKAKRLLLYSGCLASAAPSIINELSKDYAAFAVCLESTHMNAIGFKLLGAVLRTKPYEIAALTVDGSPHCIQLHYILEEVARALPYVKRRHLVCRSGRVIEVSPSAISTSRYLTKLLSLLRESEERASTTDINESAKGFSSGYARTR